MPSTKSSCSTQPTWPRSTCSRSPQLRSHTRTVLSEELVKRRPSVAATQLTGPSWPSKTRVLSTSTLADGIATGRPASTTIRSALGSPRGNSRARWSMQEVYSERSWIAAVVTLAVWPTNVRSTSCLRPSRCTRLPPTTSRWPFTSFIFAAPSARGGSQRSSRRSYTCSVPSAHTASRLCWCTSKPRRPLPLCPPSPLPSGATERMREHGTSSWRSAAQGSMLKR
mmetsp:Transcript_15340/g.59971  ORF Transcript_15340/g.59971 Transcript_15340/m.59971 type:complete len:225 (-) Transcript_15340:78-752(-)